MLTLKKLQTEINELKAKQNNTEKLKELNIILNKIKTYYEKKINNELFIEAIDLTEEEIITCSKSKSKD